MHSHEGHSHEGIAKTNTATSGPFHVKETGGEFQTLQHELKSDFIRSYTSQVSEDIGYYDSVLGSDISVGLRKRHFVGEK